MAHHSEAQYTAWLREQTGIASAVVRVDDKDCPEMLCILVLDTHRQLREIFRVPSRIASTQSLFLAELPEYLKAESATFEIRMEFFSICIRHPRLRSLIVGELAEMERNDISSLIQNYVGKFGQLLFRLDDIAIRRLQMNMEGDADD